jgi:hypothetical protein
MDECNKFMWIGRKEAFVYEIAGDSVIDQGVV